MSVEKRCMCENDFIELVMESQVGYAPFSNDSRQKMAQQTWQYLTVEEAAFLDKYGYIDIIYDGKIEKFVRKKVVGRPKAIKKKENRITIRFDNEQYEALGNFCQENNINDKSELIREAVMRLIEK